MRQLMSKFINIMKTQAESTSSYTTSPSNLICSEGMMVYHIDRRGYFSIQGEDGSLYFPCNSRQFPKLLKDRLRVRFKLEHLPGISNYYRHGKTVRILELEAVS